MIEYNQAEKHQGAEPVGFKEISETKNAAHRSLLPGSILIAAVLIAGSVFYNTKLIMKKLDNLRIGGNMPEAKLQVPERAGEAVLGNKNAKVTMVEFSDFQCPYCQKFFKETFSQIKSKYIDTGKVKLVFRNFPLPNHVNAQKAAQAAECANRQGKFEQYHDLLFKNAQPDGTGLAMADLKKYADQLGLNKGALGFNSNQFNQCLENGETAEAISQDLAAGQAVGVNGTPSFIVDGKLFIGAQPYAIFEQAIETAVK